MERKADSTHRLVSRRCMLGGAVAIGGGAIGLWRKYGLKKKETQPVVIVRARHYGDDLKKRLLSGLAEIGFTSRSVAKRRVLLKPNLVEPNKETEHVNTHPLLIQATIEAFRSLGAASVTVAEGAGHVRDPYFVLEESGLLMPLAEDRTPFVDLNFAPVATVRNKGRKTPLSHLVLPRAVLEADILVSLAKMKTHHWASATLSMKNLFGIMPGSYYGWPKNLLHQIGITESILDINATVRPHLAIVDGIVGMGGDGPIMGTPVEGKVIVLGTNVAAVDATCARIMMLSPDAIPYLSLARGLLGPIDEQQIEQRGERIDAVQTAFPLLDYIPAQQRLRLGRRR